LSFFGTIADHIVRDFEPTTVLDAGCAKGFLVEALRARGVEAFGIDVSEYAIGHVHESVAEHCRVALLTEPLDRRYDLVTCIEVIEHLPAAEARAAIDNLAASTDRLLLSSSPADYGEPTHLNVQPPEHWSALLAAGGLLRDLDYDAGYITAWAALYTRRPASTTEVVRAYDRSWWRMRDEVQALRAKVVEMQVHLEELTSSSLSDEAERQLRKEILRLRDLVVGKDAELATALGRAEELEATIMRYDNLEQQLNAMRGSTSWRLTQALGLPLRKFRTRGTRGE
jgi:SAM-dependent methyltransferase